MFYLIRRVAVLLVLCAATNIAVSADLPDAVGSADKLTSARALIANKKWDAAIDELKRINDSQSADWNNLMGYSLRKAPAADLAGAERFYNRALQVNPKHRGALEYSGELYLMKGDLAQAEQRLATLDKECRFSCTEHRELMRAVQRFKDNGNRYVVAP